MIPLPLVALHQTACVYSVDVCISELICSLTHSSHSYFVTFIDHVTVAALQLSYIHTYICTVYGYTFPMRIRTSRTYVQLSYFYMYIDLSYAIFPICTALLLCCVFPCTYRAFPVYFPNIRIAPLYSLALVKIIRTYIHMLCMYIVAVCTLLYMSLCVHLFCICHHAVCTSTTGTQSHF